MSHIRDVTTELGVVRTTGQEPDALREYYSLLLVVTVLKQ